MRGPVNDERNGTQGSGGDSESWERLTLEPISDSSPHEAPTRPSPETPEDPLIGQQVGDCEVASRVASGGFATVYRARDIHLQRDVALKFLRDPLQEDHRRLFEREARAVAALGSHPGVVQIYGWGEHEGRAYMALEFLPYSASDLLQDNRDGLPLKAALEIVADVAEALEYAHGQQILHRDIKPGNILIDREMGQAKLADFGLARFCRPGEESVLSGAIGGSLPYMSPEATEGEHVDSRSDLFSLGVTLYQLLSGHLPFAASTDYKIIDLIRHGDAVPLREHRPELPAAVFAIVDKATASNPASRYASAGEMAQDIRLVLEGLTSGTSAGALLASQAPQPAAPRGLRWVATAALALALAALVVALSVFWRGDGSAHVAFARAVESMNRSSFAEAEGLYREALEQDADEDEVWYGLAYAQLQQQRIAEAAQTFGHISDKGRPLRLEGQGAVAYSEDGEQARPALSAAAEEAATDYPDTLLASLDLAEKKPDSALERLGALSGDRFKFDWQRAEFLHALGQAHYRTGDLDSAARIFRQLQAGLPESRAAAWAAAYLTVSERQLDRERMDRVGKKAAELRRELDARQYTPPTSEELWSSRPLRFFVLPVDPGNSRLAMTSGLVDVLPGLLAGALSEATPMELVNRDLIHEILMEQQLSAYLSSASGQLALGQVLGARLMVECKLGRLMREDFLTTEVVDTETTLQRTPERIDLSGAIQPDVLIDQLVANIWEAVRKAYPVRGRLTRGPDGAEVDVGSSVGLREGTRFAILTEPDANARVPAVAAVVAAPPLATRAHVRLDGIDLDRIPDEGWFVIEEEAASSGPS